MPAERVRAERARGSGEEGAGAGVASETDVGKRRGEGRTGGSSSVSRWAKAYLMDTVTSRRSQTYEVKALLSLLLEAAPSETWSGKAAAGGGTPEGGGAASRRR